MPKAIWMSDLHFSQSVEICGYDTRARLRAAIDHINTYHSDAQLCLISGDLVNLGNSIDYSALAAEIGALNMPCMPMMGNHDDRELLRSHLPLPTDCMTDFIQYAVATSDGVFACLDTHKTGSSEGEFCEQRLAWLETLLSSTPDVPVFLFMHHPPMKLGLPMQDADNMQGGDAFLDLICRFPSTRYLFFGHVHRPISGTVRGIPFSSMHSVAFQAPAPQPLWDWQNFQPAREAPALGVLFFEDGDVIVQYTQFCAHDFGMKQ